MRRFDHREGARSTNAIEELASVWRRSSRERARIEVEIGAAVRKRIGRLTAREAERDQLKRWTREAVHGERAVDVGVVRRTVADVSIGVIEREEVDGDVSRDASARVQEHRVDSEV